MATYIASQREIHHLFLHAPFPNIKKVIPSYLLTRFFSYYSSYRFYAEYWAKEVTSPVSIIHGSRDNIIPLFLGKAQEKNFINSPQVDFYSIKGAGHNNIQEFSAFAQILESTLQQY